MFLLLMCFRCSCALFLNVVGIFSAHFCACLYVVQNLVVFPMCLIVCIDIFIFRYVFDVFPNNSVSYAYIISVDSTSGMGAICSGLFSQNGRCLAPHVSGAVKCTSRNAHDDV